MTALDEFNHRDGVALTVAGASILAAFAVGVVRHTIGAAGLVIVAGLVILGFAMTLFGIVIMKSKRKQGRA